jgi:hypothetical protein
MTDDIDNAYIEVRSGTLRWRIWADGRVSGFPCNATITNRLMPFITRREVIREAAEKENKRIADFKRRASAQQI